VAALPGSPFQFNSKTSLRHCGIAPPIFATEAGFVKSELRITGLFTYPIKSCGAIAHASVGLDGFGLQWDRRWMLVDPAGRFVTQRTLPRLALVTPVITETELRIVAPGRAPLEVPLAGARTISRIVTVWNDGVAAWDEGEAPAAWFSAFTGSPLRLVRFPDDTRRPVSARYATIPGSTTAFADGFPLLLATEESLADLNQRLRGRTAAAVPMSRFRPNVVLAGAERPWAEDDWLSLRVGELQLDIVKPCARCIMTTTDQLTGMIPEPGEPLATLSTYRRWEGHPVFAQNVIAHGRGPLVLNAPTHVMLQGLRNRWGIAGPNVSAAGPRPRPEVPGPPEFR